MAFTSYDSRVNIAVREGAVAVAFWIAILLAFSYPPMLYAIGSGIVDHTLLLLAITVHVFALLLGRNYGEG